MKLTKADIQFIDTYLENSKVKHVDIRLEMVDHVATAIEAQMQNGDNRSFYYVFKDYMVENKAKLLDNNQKFLREATNKLSKQILKSFFSLKSLLLLAVSIVVIYYSLSIIDVKHHKETVFAITMCLIILPGMVYAILHRAFNYQRFSSFERLSFFFLVLVQLINLVNITIGSYLRNGINTIVLSIILGLIVTFLFVFLKVSISVFKNCKQQLKQLSKT